MFIPLSKQTNNQPSKQTKEELFLLTSQNTMYWFMAKGPTGLPRIQMPGFAWAMDMEDASRDFFFKWSLMSSTFHVAGPRCACFTTRLLIANPRRAQTRTAAAVARIIIIFIFFFFARVSQKGKCTCSLLVAFVFFFVCLFGFHSPPFSPPLHSLLHPSLRPPLHSPLHPSLRPPLLLLFSCLLARMQVTLMMVVVAAAACLGSGGVPTLATAGRSQDGTCHYVSNLIIGEDNIATEPAQTAEECCAACFLNTACVAFTLDTSSKTCFLKDNTRGNKTQSNRISGTNGRTPVNSFYACEGPFAHLDFCDTSVSVDDRVDRLIKHINLKDVGAQQTARQSPAIADIGLPAYYWGTNAIHVRSLAFFCFAALSVPCHVVSKFMCAKAALSCSLFFSSLLF